jgi:uncharacterized membrane protein
VRAHRDLIAASAGSLVCAAIALLVPVEAIRVLAAVPLALVLPGWAVTAACFARQRPDLATVAMLTPALSLSLLALDTVALHLLPGRFGEASWLVVLTATTVAACAIAARRRPRREPAPPIRFSLTGLPRPGAAAGLLSLAALLVAVAVVLAATVLPARDAVGYTRLWMLPSATTAAAPHLRIGVINQEQDAGVYRLAIRGGGLRTIRRMDLAPGEQRIWRVRLPPADGAPARVSARLYRADDPLTVYRRVNGWTPSS